MWFPLWQLDHVWKKYECNLHYAYPIGNASKYSVARQMYSSSQISRATKSICYHPRRAWREAATTVLQWNDKTQYPWDCNWRIERRRGKANIYSNVPQNVFRLTDTAESRCVPISCQKTDRYTWWVWYVLVIGSTDSLGICWRSHCVSCFGRRHVWLCVSYKDSCTCSVALFDS